MKIFGSINIPNKIEFISYSPQYHDQVLDVIRKSFFQYETVSVGSEINTNAEAQKDLEILCDDVLTKSGVSVIARDVEGDKIVGVSLNVIQVKTIKILIRMSAAINQSFNCRSMNHQVILRRILR